MMNSNISQKIIKSFEIHCGNVNEKYINCEKCGKMHIDDKFECFVYCEKCETTHRNDELSCIMTQLTKRPINTNPWSNLTGD